MNNILVDEIDKDLLESYEWSLNNMGYARTRFRVNGKQLYLHKLIAARMGLSVNIDHVDGNPLNNRRSNLRECNHKTNGANRCLSSNNTSGYKGVTRNNGKLRPWKASITVDDKTKFIGTFATAEEAARAYDEAALAHWGEYAKTNAMLGLL